MSREEGKEAPLFFFGQIARLRADSFAVVVDIYRWINRSDLRFLREKGERFMRRIAAFILIFVMMFSGSSAFAEGAAESIVTDGKGKIVVLATGGTIAGVGEAGKTAGYKPGTLTAEELLSAVPQLADVAEIEAIQVCNVNSDDITVEVWITLANNRLENSTVKGLQIEAHAEDTGNPVPEARS